MKFLKKHSITIKNNTVFRKTGMPEAHAGFCILLCQKKSCFYESKHEVSCIEEEKVI